MYTEKVANENLSNDEYRDFLKRNSSFSLEIASSKENDVLILRTFNAVNKKKWWKGSWQIYQSFL